MKAITKDILFTAWDYCDEHDKSTEFMLQYMQDMANVDLDCVIKFLKNTSEEERSIWYKKRLENLFWPSAKLNGNINKIIIYKDE